MDMLLAAVWVMNVLLVAVWVVTVFLVAVWVVTAVFLATEGVVIVFPVAVRNVDVFVTVWFSLQPISPSLSVPCAIFVNCNVNMKTESLIITTVKSNESLTPHSLRRMKGN